MYMKFLAAVLVTLLCSGCLSSIFPGKDNPNSGDTSGLVYLDQGWDQTNKFRELSYYTPQGSHLIPYKWFLALEQPGNERLIRDPSNMNRLRFLTHRPQPEEDGALYEQLNPDGLPVGFVKDPPFKKGAPDKEGWMGFNCSACHTNQVNYKGVGIRVDGGPSMADFQGFLEEVRNALNATVADSAKFDRFAKRVNREDSSVLKEELKKFTEGFNELVRRNHSPLRYGFARLDAFGAIINEVAKNMGQPQDILPANAPVSYPFIWDAPKLDFVQWNRSVDNPIARNAGEVVGVYGEITPQLSKRPPFKSSIRLHDLFNLEQWLVKLESPKWPEEHLPKIDRPKAEKGKKLYDRYCNGCHANDLSKNMTDPKENFAGKTFIKTNGIYIEKMRTDPRMATNFAGRFFETGPVVKALMPEWKAECGKVPAGMVLGKFIRVLVGPELLKLPPEQFLEYTGYRVNPKDPEAPVDCTKATPEIKKAMLKEVLVYKARPLNGIWATAPYLHNGSVPNLYQLLLKESERDSEFCVGSREFDPVHVGFKYKPDPQKGCGNDFTFDTKLQGNLNTGHNFTSRLEEEERWQLVEYLKTL
ncbi:MAG: cytochrome C [Candidatus Nitronauta litoralis]|uniref:Cytochrome C n=1 Tax=Candidatus Nitronauta litoralis TaxID=2705533 RepID=A0A7T0FYX9_9BACT|nr:MAG: cytochrome C [Candidatus Nitronauta litoralis]